jgi:hypothetical protein
VSTKVLGPLGDELVQSLGHGGPPRPNEDDLNLCRPIQLS